MLKNEILKNECSICGLSETWQNKPIVMRLDHINGINNDNHLENLRMVCPNCDSQLPTYGGRNTFKDSQRNPILQIKSKKCFCSECGDPINYGYKMCRLCYFKSKENKSLKKGNGHCLICNKKINVRSKRCRNCASQQKQTKINWPSNEELREMIFISNRLQVSKKLGVSETAVRKRLKSRKIVI